jgi:hypothetical protein
VRVIADDLAVDVVNVDVAVKVGGFAVFGRAADAVRYRGDLVGPERR